VGLSMYNKCLFSGVLRTPIFVTSTHRICSFVGASLVWQLSPSSYYKRTKINSYSMVKKILVVPVGFVLNIGMNNLSLNFTTLALNQLIRAFSPVSIAMTSYLIEGKTQSVTRITTLLCLVAGVAMGVFTSPDFEVLGATLCCASLLGQALSIVMTAHVMDGTRVKLAVYDVLLYASLPSLLVLLPLSYFLGELDVLRSAIEKEGLRKIAWLLLGGGILAFCYNVAATTFIRITSSIYYGVTGGFRCALTITMSYFIFPQRATALSIVGTVVAMLAFTTNSYFKERRSASKAAAKNEFVDESAESAEKERLIGENRRVTISNKA